ncbi:MAG: PhzF family phenazine biosynthesis protein [Chitinophagaceae bacterium]|nr:MAG: PhzF family phenazine biosynthesis protein [Chitinophagaceae bacterium]
MTFDIYQVDAFTNKLYGGNPAAVVPLKTWLPEETMQLLAMENNLSETVFFVPSDNSEVADYDIRWFTPDVEINLCGHATLGSAYILFNKLNHKSETIRFNSKSGVLIISQVDGKIKMDFPSWKPTPMTEIPPLLLKALGVTKIKGLYRYRDLLVELDEEAAVKNCDPDFNLMKKLGIKVIITAPGQSCDFVSRFFASEAGINEDPVTGSAHSQLIPFWSERLNKTSLHALQLSKRGGELWCEDLGSRVTIAGHCVFYMKGQFEI